MSTPVCLAGYAVALAVAAPWLLARVAGAGYAPRLGITAWLLAVASVAGSLLGAAVVLVWDGGAVGVTVGAAGLVVAVARFGWAVGVTWRVTHARRVAHREMLALVGRLDQGLGATLVDAAEPLVYCLPAPAPTVVVTTGARRVLSRAQLRAALSHEWAHLAGRHHLLLVLGYALGRAAPWLPLFTRTGPAVAALLEMRADDVAARRHGRRTVAAAIAALGRRAAPVGALGVAGPSALSRGLRLSGVQPAWRVCLGRVGLAVTVVALAAGPYLYSVSPLCARPW